MICMWTSRKEKDPARTNFSPKRITNSMAQMFPQSTLFLQSYSRVRKHEGIFSHQGKIFAPGKGFLTRGRKSIAGICSRGSRVNCHPLANINKKHVSEMLVKSFSTSHTLQSRVHKVYAILQIVSSPRGSLQTPFQEHHCSVLTEQQRIKTKFLSLGELQNRVLKTQVRKIGC